MLCMAVRVRCCGLHLAYVPYVSRHVLLVVCCRVEHRYVAMVCRASHLVQITPAGDVDEHGLFDRWLFQSAQLELQCSATVRHRRPVPVQMWQG